LFRFLQEGGTDRTKGVLRVAKISLEIMSDITNHHMLPQLLLRPLNGKFRDFFNTLALKGVQYASLPQEFYK